MPTPIPPLTLYTPIRCRMAEEPFTEFESGTQAALHFNVSRSTIFAMLRRGQLLYWHDGRWLSKDEYKASEKQLAALRRAPMEKHKRVNNWYNKQIKKEAAIRRGEKALAERAQTNAKPIFDVGSPSIVYPSIAEAARKLGKSVKTVRNYISKDVLREGIPTPEDFKRARGES